MGLFTSLLLLNGRNGRISFKCLYFGVAADPMCTFQKKLIRVKPKKADGLITGPVSPVWCSGRIFNMFPGPELL